jgi:hypothetical protein
MYIDLEGPGPDVREEITGCFHPISSLWSGGRGRVWLCCVLCCARALVAVVYLPLSRLVQ